MRVPVAIQSAEMFLALLVIVALGCSNVVCAKEAVLQVRLKSGQVIEVKDKFEEVYLKDDPVVSFCLRGRPTAWKIVGRDAKTAELLYFSGCVRFQYGQVTRTSDQMCDLCLVNSEVQVYRLIDSSNNFCYKSGCKAPDVSVSMGVIPTEWNYSSGSSRTRCKYTRYRAFC